MSSVSLNTCCFEGTEVIPVETQVHIANGLPSLTIVGLGDKAVKESRDRIRAAISSIGIQLPAKRITINLAPADIVKEGSHFDLPITLAILAAINAIDENAANKYLILGELALDGRILPVSGILPAAINANALEIGIICPADNAQEAIMAGRALDIIPAKNLTQLINHLKGISYIEAPDFNPEILTINKTQDMYDVRGQFAAKRAIEIAASGRHNIIMYGPPGTGKSMLASRLSSILPEMSTREILESSIIRSIAGEFKYGMFLSDRPYRDPHHSSSMPAIIGGGRDAKPGEISLAHNGILFLDELPEFQRNVLDSLRQPIENGYVNVARVNKHAKYPAKFQLVAAMNPCKCGYFGNENKECKKVPNCAQEYQAKISGPIMDRIDIHVEVSNFIPKLEDDASDRGEKSDTIKARVAKARDIQLRRYKGTDIITNSDLNGEMISKYCILSDKAKIIMQNAIDKLDLSMRSHNKILKLARTIADMSEHDEINDRDILESLSYRAKILGK